MSDDTGSAPVMLRSLDAGWSVHAVGGDVPTSLGDRSIPAAVPGCVHTDLLGAGAIPDPYLDRNEDEVAWIGWTEWCYAISVDWTRTEADRVDLVCEGLDTIAELTLNAAVIGRTANMHRSYRFPVTDLLRDGSNDLAITFASAEAYGEQQRAALGDRPNAYPAPFNFVRKMACSFGWDWGPRLVTAGIWRPISLHAWSVVRLARVRPIITVDGGIGRVKVAVDLERAGALDEPLTLVAEVGGARGEASVPPGASSAAVEVTLDRPALWWPHSHGDQPLYDLRVWVSRAGEQTDALDAWSRRIGFRTVRLDTSPDEAGSPFTLVVNDVPVFARGANWIPDDCFPSRMTRDRYRQRIEQARSANIDLLRVWGGGIYESRDFYEACDELGVLVWQDFLFACAAYPEERPLRDEVEAEAREAVARLMPHPSLALWNGGNETIWGWFDWGWREALDGRTWGAGYYFDLLPAVVADVDPTRPYWPGSPYSGSLEVHPNDDSHGPMHLWDVWNAKDYTAYRDHVPRFAAEFGFQGPPAWATIRRSISDDPLEPDSPGMLHHQKANDGNGKLLRRLGQHFWIPSAFDDWHFLTQVNQARAVALGIEHFRSHRPRCMGAVMWQLNDCWPVTSWAAIDGDGRRKPLWYALRRAYAPLLLTVQPRAGGLAVVAVNDTAQEWRAEVAVARRGFDGRRLGEHRAAVRCEPWSLAEVTIPTDVAAPGRDRGELLEATAGSLRALWFFAPDKDLDYPSPDFRASIEPADDGLALTVEARSLLRDLALFADRLDPDAVVDDMLVTLLPGQSATFGVKAGTGFDAEALLSPPVLRCVNDARRAPRP